MKNMKHIIFLAIGGLFVANMLQASSHREAPLIAYDPLADNTDVYAFRSPDDPNSVILIANYIPFQLPHGGPNYYFFGENVRYEIHVDNNTATAGDDIIYRFTFDRTNEDPSTFFNIRLGAQNLKNTYTLERSIDGGASFQVILNNGTVPPYNVGERSIGGAAGLNTTYEQLMADAIHTTSTGEMVFAGPVDDPFFVDLAAVFDLGDLPRQNGTPKDNLACLNVHSIVLKVPISNLQKDGMHVSQASNILDPDFVIGVWASASRQSMRTLNTEGTQEFTGPWVQVSRLGMPLTNEAVIPIGKKDLWNSLTPYEDLANIGIFGEHFYNPELALYMDDDLFGGAVPAFGPLRIQRNSLQAFDFGNGQSGLWPLKGSAAVAGTALDDAIFGSLLLPADNSPRSVDLWPIFHTGVPNLAPYQLATGKNGNPLANGKPFINNFLPNGGDMLRLNMAVPATKRNDPAFSSLGLIAAAVAGLTDPMYNTTTDLEFIPNMDGFPNGRRLEDDVTRIELQAVGGVVLAAIGLWYDDYTAGDENPVTADLLGVLTYTTGVEMNDLPFQSMFPYLAPPHSGTGACSGLPIAYDQPEILDPTKADIDCRFTTLSMIAWGLPSQSNVGMYLHQNFATAFPNGLQIGCTNTLTLTSAQAVTNFLPSFGFPGKLQSGMMTNPTNYGNLLAGRLVAATLNVGMDANDPDFGPGNFALGNAYFTFGPFEGWQVHEVLAAANAYIGDCGSPFTRQQIHVALGVINFAGYGKGALSCTMMEKKSVVSDAADAATELHVYPNPASDMLFISTTFATDALVTMDLFDLSGRMLMNVASFQVEAGMENITTTDISQLPNGVYLLRVLHGEQLSSRRVIVSK